MLLTFLFGALCMWLFVTACDIRYIRRLAEENLDFQKQLVKAINELLHLITQEQ